MEDLCRSSLPTAGEFTLLDGHSMDWQEECQGLSLLL